MKPQTLVDYTKSLDCIHCGLCLRTCPTYRLTGVESSSPRGRVHLMRAMAEGTLDPSRDVAEEMDFCLVCRNCESACPSGVRFGEMMETVRDGLQREVEPPLYVRFARWVGFRVILPNRFALSLTAFALRTAQKLGLTKLAGKFGERGRGVASLPEVPPASERRPLPEYTPARGAKRGEVLLLEGCAMPEFFGRVNRATAGVVAAAGFDARTVPGHVCCGALHAHNGDLEGARQLARSTIEAFDGDAPIVVNSAGCGAHMKEWASLFDEGDPMRERAERVSARVGDLSEFLVEEASDELAQRMQGTSTELSTPITFDDPCHLCHGQQIRSQPRKLLDLTGETPRVELEESESCCGSAGIYSVLRPADSRAILSPRLDALEKSGAKTLVTANPGCHLQWMSGIRDRGLDVEVLHIAEVLERSLK